MYKTLIQFSPDAILVADPEGRITEISHRVAEQFACGQPGEILGTSVFDRVAPEYRSKVRSALEEESWDGRVRKMEIRFLRIDGTSFIGEAFAGTARDEAGRSTVLILSVRDVTESILAAARLRESEERFRSIFEGSLDAIFIADPDTGRILDANPAAEEMLLLPPEKIVGMRQWEIYPEPLRAEEEKRFSEYVLDSAQSTPEEKGVQRSDGSLVHAEMLAQIIQLAGAPVLYSTFRDVTARKKMEEQKQESQVHFRHLADQSPNMIFINLNGRVVYANRMCQETMEYSPDEFLSPDFPFLSLLWGDHAERARENFLRHAAGEEVPPTEYEMVTKSGRRITGILATRLIRVQGERAILGIVTDITERKRTETALAASELRYRALVRTSPDCVIVTDAAGTVTEVSQQTIDRLGHGSPQEMTGRDLQEFLLPGSRETLRKALQNVRKSGSVRNLEISLFRKDGTSFLGELNLSAVEEMGQSPGILVFAVRDIERRKRMEMELARIEKLESLGVLAGGIAHDFNNILTAISTNISMAQMFGNLDEETAKMMADAEAASARARNLTQQLLTFSRGGLPVKKPISLSRLLVETAEFTLSGSHAICTFDLPEELPAVEADEGQISQVIQNLILNADQAMPGGGTIRIRAETHFEETEPSALLSAGRHVRITIADQGTGIPEKHLNRIFDPFFTTKQKGSGLGLSTTFSIVKNHGGHIQVQSKMGEGSTFVLTLPATEKPVEAKRDRKGSSVKGGGRILVIDDDEMVRRSAGKTLQRLGYSVTFAEEGRKGIEIYQAARKGGAPFDAVILDVTIPGGMGGTEAMGELLKIDPQARGIVSSGYANDPVMARFREYGFRGVIQKPYEIVELGGVVDRAIREDGPEEGR
jgi:PAS domain S-box-containing protein